MSCVLFILFPCLLFEIVANGSAKTFLNVCGVVRKQVLCDFLHFGILCITEKGN